MSTAADLLKQVRHTIVAGVDVYGAMNEAIHTVTRRLYQINSKLVHDDLAVALVEDDTHGSLPADFWGMDSHPYLSGHTYTLLPLPSVEVQLTYTGTGIPRYYKVKGTYIYVTPTAGASYTIIGDYYVKPTKIAATTTTVPYNELFDDVICDYMKMYFKSPPGGVINIPQNWLDKIDLAAGKREKKAPFHTNVNGMGIPWSSM